MLVKMQNGLFVMTKIKELLIEYKADQSDEVLLKFEKSILAFHP